jgi:hypothetical protein
MVVLRCKCTKLKGGRKHKAKGKKRKCKHGRTKAGKCRKKSK